MRSREKTDLGMIRYSSFRSMAVQAQNFHRKENELSHRGEGLRKIRKILEHK